MPRLPITAPTLQGAGRSPLAQGVLLALAAAALLLEQWLQDGPDPVLPATIERCQTADAAAS